jgi:cation diffusion facilitator CzcD-associated flavoprotein CzcO
LQYSPRKPTMGSTGQTTFEVKRIAIIGAGPCGLAAAKFLRGQGAFDSITIYEQQEEVGGIWFYSDRPSGTIKVPQTDPFCPPDPPLPAREDGGPPVFPSPMYEKLHANIFGFLMNFTNLKFPAGSWIFPSRENIQSYVVEYAQDVRHMIKFCFEVTSLRLEPEADRDKWRLTARSTVNDDSVDEIYDAVVVANGHYSIPYIPTMDGIQPFHQAHPGVILHSKHYRSATTYTGQKVIIVGNGPSGIDVAYQIGKAGPRALLLSVRHATPPDKLAHVGAEEVAEIKEFLPDQKGVRFADGRVAEDIDAIIFCTGFLFSYPFMPDLAHKLLTTGQGLHGLYQHLFDIRHPTLVFPGLNMKAVPWPVSEGQAAVFAAVWANALQLPPVEQMEAWEKALHDKMGEALHVFPTEADGLYINLMHDWAIQANPQGKEPPYWDDEQLWQRKIFAEAKIKFEQMGGTATTLEEIGFVYPGKPTA